MESIRSRCTKYKPKFRAKDYLQFLKEIAYRIRIENVNGVFHLNNGRMYKLFHDQSCCENVYIDDVCGELNDLVDSPLLQAEESSNSDVIPDKNVGDDSDYLWTFYKFATRKGHVTVRWYGSSNGYYSVSVDFIELYDGTRCAHCYEIVAKNERDIYTDQGRTICRDCYSDNIMEL